MMKQLLFVLLLSSLLFGCSNEEGELKLKIVTNEKLDDDGKFPDFLVQLMKIQEIENEGISYEFQPKIEILRLDLDESSFQFEIPHEAASSIKKKMNFYSIKEYEADIEYLKNDLNYEIPDEGYSYLTKEGTSKDAEKYEYAEDEKIFSISTGEYKDVIDSILNYMDVEGENQFTIRVRQDKSKMVEEQVNNSSSINDSNKSVDSNTKESTEVVRQTTTTVTNTIIKSQATPLPSNWKYQTLVNQLNYISERGYGSNRDVVLRFLKRNKFTRDCVITRTDNKTDQSIDKFLNNLKYLKNERVDFISDKEEVDGKISALSVSIKQFGN